MGGWWVCVVEPAHRAPRPGGKAWWEHAALRSRCCSNLSPRSSAWIPDDPQIHADGATSDDPEADSDDELTD